MRFLFVSHLYPNSSQMELSSYNRQLMAALIAQGAEVRVIAPVFDFPGERWIRGTKFPPGEEVLDGIAVSHPQVIRFPGIGIHRHWLGYRAAVRPFMDTSCREWQPDHVMLGFAYPDAVAMAPVCEKLSLPYSVRVNGSDFRIRVQQPRFRGMVLNVLKRAPLIFCPGKALKQDMEAEGISADRIVSFSNGVNGDVFRYRSREDAWRELSLRVQDSRLRPEATTRQAGFRNIAGLDSANLVLFVGNLEVVKGADRLMESWSLLKSARSKVIRENDAKLIIIGDGAERKRLEKMALAKGVAESVRFLGNRPHSEIGLWLNVAQCLVLPSRSEGMPNVVLEALASGCPVVATDVGEVPFLVRNEENGFIVDRNSPRLSEDLVSCIQSCLEKQWDRKSLAVGSGVEGWNEAAQVILERIRAKRGTKSDKV